MDMGTTDRKQLLHAETPALDTPTCRHHWLIESPRAATSKGRCKLCGAEREFRNSPSAYMWEEDSSDGYSPRSSAASAPSFSDDDEVAVAPRCSADEPMLLV